jgi:hypothetical protein
LPLDDLGGDLMGLRDKGGATEPTCFPKIELRSRVLGLNQCRFADRPLNLLTEEAEMGGAFRTRKRKPSGESRHLAEAPANTAPFLAFSSFQRPLLAPSEISLAV